MSEIINVETYIKKGNKLYKQLSGGANILTYDSLDEVPDDLPEGSFVAVPADDVVDFTTVFNLAESVAVGGEMVRKDYENASRVIAKMKSGPVRIKVAFDTFEVFKTVHAQYFPIDDSDSEGYCQFTDLVVYDGALLYFYITIHTYSVYGPTVAFRVQQLTTAPYVPA